MEAFLSQTAEYAIRVIAWLAARSSEEPVLARELSSGTDIPPHYLSKILRRLVVAGVLTSQKGQGGGFTLVRPPRQITFRDVLSAVDAFPRADRCAFGWGTCSARRPCPLHHSWSRMSEQFRHWACNTTFAEVKGAATRRAGRRRLPRRVR